MNLSKGFSGIENPIVKGGISEKLCTLYLELEGFLVFKPTTESGRIDCLALSKDGGIFKVQIKTMSPYHGSYRVHLKKAGKNGKTLLYSKEELDFVLAYSPIHNAVLRIPGRFCWGKHTVTLRDTPAVTSPDSKIVRDFIVLTL